MEPKELMDWFENGRAVLENSYTAYPDGRLILASTMEGLEDPQKGCLPGSFASNDIQAHLSDPGINPVSYRDGYDPIKNRKTRFAIVTREILISGEPHA